MYMPKMLSPKSYVARYLLSIFKKVSADKYMMDKAI